MSSAKRHDLDVRAYIEDILTQLLAGCTDYQALLPDVWKQSHPEAVRIYRQEARRDKADRKQVAAARRRLLKASLNGWPHGTLTRRAPPAPCRCCTLTPQRTVPEAPAGAGRSAGPVANAMRLMFQPQPQTRAACRPGEHS